MKLGGALHKGPSAEGADDIVIGAPGAEVLVISTVRGGCVGNLT